MFHRVFKYHILHSLDALECVSISYWVDVNINM